MAKKKTTKRVSPREDTEKKSSYSSPFRFGESYTSLVLGIIVVIVIALVVAVFTKTFQNTGTLENTNTLSQKTVEESLKQTQTKTHTVAEGETLWDISEKMYNSGYNWVDIAEANKLENPSVLIAGTKLTIPNVTPKTIDVPNKIQDQTYTVKEGDNLWDIAVRRYADGYKWVEIAKANNLGNPNIIHVGNTLKLP